MAITIPSYQQQVQGSVDPNVRESTDAPLQNFGGGSAAQGATDAVGAAAKQVNDVYVAQKKAADDAIGQDIFAKLTTKKNDLIYNPANGAMTQKGEDALDVVDRYGGKFQEYANNIQSSLSDPEQRRQFDHFQRKVGDELNMTLQKHTYAESQVLQQANASAAMGAAQDDARLNYMDTDKVEDSVTLQRNLYARQLNAQGIKDPATVAEMMKQQVTSPTYAGVIDQMVNNGQTSQAKDYLDLVKEDLTGSAYQAVSKTLESATMREDSTKAADDIVKTSPSMTDAMSKVNDIDDPKLRDETKARVKDAFATKELALKTDETTRYNSAAQILEKSGNLDQITPQIWANLTGPQKESLQTRYKQIRDGIEPQANGVDKYNLQTMAATPALREKFLGLNLEEYRGKVTSGELSQLMATQTSLRKSDGTVDPLLDGIRTKQQVITETLKPLGYDEKSNPTAFLEVNRQVEAQVLALQAQTGKKATSQDVQQIVDNLVVKTKDPNSGFFGMFNTRPAFQQDPKADLTVSIEDVPSTEKAKAASALRQRGWPVTDDKIVELYSRKLNGMRQRGN